MVVLRFNSREHERTNRQMQERHYHGFSTESTATIFQFRLEPRRKSAEKKRVLLVVYAKRFATNFIEKMKTNGRKIHPITGISTAMEPRIATTMKKTNTDKMY